MQLMGSCQKYHFCRESMFVDKVGRNGDYRADYLVEVNEIEEL